MKWCLCCELVPLQSLGQSLLQVGGGCWERELDCNAAAVIEDGGEVVSFRGGQDGQLVVGLTCRRHKEAAHEQGRTTNMAAQTSLTAASQSGRLYGYQTPELITHK